MNEGTGGSRICTGREEGKNPKSPSDQWSKPRGKGGGRFDFNERGEKEDNRGDD